MLGYEVTRRVPFLTGGHREMEAVLDRFLGRRDYDGGWTPPMDAYTTDSHYVLRVDLPGVGPEELEIEVEERLLTIRGERKGEEKDHYLRETFHGRFRRTVRLPNGIDAEKIEARYRNGVIEVQVPLPAKAVGRKVPIRSEVGEPKAVEHGAG
jgi:HSP20 family protein